MRLPRKVRDKKQRKSHVSQAAADSNSTETKRGAISQSIARSDIDTIPQRCTNDQRRQNVLRLQHFTHELVDVKKWNSWKQVSRKLPRQTSDFLILAEPQRNMLSVPVNDEERYEKSPESKNSGLEIYPDFLESVGPVRLRTVCV